MADRQHKILISGAGSGVGRGLSQLFSGKGHHVFVTDKNLATAQETVSPIEATGGSASAHAVDVTDEAAAGALMAEIGDESVDVLINNAGFQHVAKLEEFPQETWDSLVAVVLKGTCVLTRAVLPKMREKGFGRIINIGSIHSLVASAYKTAYVSAKHALLGFSKVVALETGDVDITINTICPSYIHTPLVDAQIKDQARTRGITEDEVIETVMLKPMPKGKFIEIEEVAGTTEFLMSDLARNITGQAIAIDGGWTIQ